MPDSSPTSPVTFTLGHSPDPDDAFMFYALAENKIDTRGFAFEHTLQDIQTLNERAMRGELHISAVSIHAYSYLLDKYALLPSGASMGDGYGPLLVTKSREGLADDASYDEVCEWLKTRKVAVPGPMTSASLALKIFAGDLDTVDIPFDKIFDAIEAGDVDAGVVIHEGQLTYQDEGFLKVVDLGEWWKGTTGLPLPLGGNVIRKDIDRAVRTDIAHVLKASIEYGLEHRQAGVEHSLPLARGMADQIDKVDEFIGMYVNDYTIDYGETGRAAIREFLGQASELGYIPAPVDLEFVEY